MNFRFKNIHLRIISFVFILAILFAALPTNLASEVFAAETFDFEDVLLYGSGSDEGKAVITIVGDGYLESEIEPTPGADPRSDTAFMAAAKRAADMIANEYPFTYFRDSGTLNIHAIKVVSNVSGTGMSTPKDTFFRVYRSLGGATIYPSGEGKVRQQALLAQYTPNTAATIIIANKPQGGDVAMPSERTVCLSTSAFSTHEIGHALANLADEDDRSSGRYERPTLSANGDPNTVRWKSFIGLNGVTMAHYTRYGSWYSPGAPCMMGSINTGRDYCLVCSAAITEMLAEITKEPFYGTLYNGISTSSGFTSKPLNTQASISMPGDISRILPFAFHGCDRLKTLTIPEGVKTIGEYAFLKCTGLTSVTNNARTPQNITGGGDRFQGVTRSNITLRVPKGTTANYLAAGWTGFKEIIEDGSDILIDAEEPAILSSSIDKSVLTGDEAPLAVVASVPSGGVLSYQWYETQSMTNSGGTAIPGATLYNYSPQTDSAGVRYYYCVVTNTDPNATGKKTASVSSPAVSVTVTAPVPDFKINNIEISGEETLKFTVKTQGGVQEIKYALYIIGDGNVYHKVVYSDVNTFSYTPGEGKNYTVRAYAIDSTGEKIVFSEPFTIS